MPTQYSKNTDSSYNELQKTYPQLYAIVADTTTFVAMLPFECLLYSYAFIVLSGLPKIISMFMKLSLLIEKEKNQRDVFLDLTLFFIIAAIQTTVVIKKYMAEPTLVHYFLFTKSLEEGIGYLFHLPIALTQGNHGEPEAGVSGEAFIPVSPTIPTEPAVHPSVFSQQGSEPPPSSTLTPSSSA